MTLNRIAQATAAALLTFAAGMATAADTQNLTVTANVVALCKFTSAAQTLSFGDLDPYTAADVNGSGATVQYKCTKGTPALSVDVGAGMNGGNKMKNTANADLIPYTLTAAPAVGNGNGFGAGAAALDVTLTSQVLGASYQTKSAGTYNDTVVLTINY